jgi:hypothetical protein
MNGFRNVAEWATAQDAGRSHVTTFRKQVASAATVANDFIDYTYFAGNPPANFYASAPLVAAEVEGIRGLLLPNVGKSQWMKSLTVMSAASSNTNTTNQNQRLALCDYLLYYPFIDTDAVGEEQVMDNTVTVPRYAAGGQIMCVAQSASSTVGQFTVNYTNQDGVPGRISQNTFTKVVAGGGILVSSTNATVAGSQQFVNLQAGDTLARSIESVTFTAAGGGLMALVIVRDLYSFYSTQECRRNTDLSVGAASQFESLIHHDRPPEVKSGAVLGVVGLGNAGTLASSVLVGTLETYWSE